MEDATISRQRKTCVIDISGWEMAMESNVIKETDLEIHAEII